MQAYIEECHRLRTALESQVIQYELLQQQIETGLHQEE
jgi:hypothetical protein